MNKKAFTLVELVMSISIMSILGVITLLSFFGYSTNTRNSVRTADLGNMESLIEMFEVKTGKLPKTTNGHTVVYSGAIVWTQGTFGETTRTLVSNLSEIPLDPKTLNQYTYSKTSLKEEYELGAIYEGIQLYGNLKLVESVYADELRKATAIVKGTYNGIIVKAENLGTTYVLAVPSIISSDLSSLEVADIFSNKRFVYNKYLNLPASYNQSGFNLNGGFDFNSDSYLVYESSTDLFELNNTGIQVQFARDVQKAYAGTIMGFMGGNVQNILSVDTVNDLDGTLLLAQSLINHYVNETVEVESN